MHRHWDTRAHRVFRWSWLKIRALSVQSGMGVGIAIAAASVISMLGDPPVVHWLDAWLVAAGVSLGCAILTGMLVWGILAIARASTGTIVFLDGLLIRQALWQTRFIAWTDIAGVELRSPTGWTYAFIRSAAGGPELAMTVEVDDPEGLAEAIEAAAPIDSPLRTIFRGN